MTQNPALTLRSLLIAATVFLLLTVLHTWPLTTDLAGLSRNDNNDTTLNEWAVSWVAHQIIRDPMHLFDANIFHPHRHTLAYSEPLILPGLVGAPLRWLGSSPVLTYNLLLLLGFVTTGLAMYVVVATWTNDKMAALLSGSLLAFNAHTLTRLPHLQAIFAVGLPLALWAFDRLVQRGQTRHAVWLALSVLMCALTSGHLAVFTFFALSAALVARPEVWWRFQNRTVLLKLAIAAAVTLVVTLLILWPYQLLHSQEDFQRPLDGLIAATPMTYLSTAANMHYNWWSNQIFRVVTEETLFPGFTAIVLSVAAFALSPRAISTAGRMLLAIGTVGFVMSLGMSTPVYAWFYELVPPVAGIRVAARFGFLTILAVAGLAGLGLAKLRHHWPSRWMTIVSIGALAVASIEALHAPMPYIPYKGIPAIYQPIAADPEPGAVLDLPFYDGLSAHRNAPYMLATTTHWKPLVNGYSGHKPANFDQTVRRMNNFPASETIEALRALGVRYVVVHVNDYRSKDRVRKLITDAARNSSIRLVAATDEHRLYRIR